MGDSPKITTSGISLDESCLRATLNGQDLQLTAAEFRLLNFLVSHPGRVYNRQQLLNNIYPDDRALNDRAIDNFIKNIRKKINPLSNGVEMLHSVYGAGYKFEIND
jgi:two-component system response regulator BaeR